ncbi:MAG: hypothetical protein PHG95_00505 [Patescibacteria group bacterium]|nr:hypothetical protein [Patescibacteria group bacterium]
MIIRSVNTPTRRQSIKKNFSWRTLNIFLSLACVALGLTYLVGINDLTVKGFALKDLKSQQQMLMEANQDLQAKVLGLQSYASISPRLQGLNMVAVEDVAYLSSKTPVVAKK